MEAKINEIQAYRDAQAKQLVGDIKGWSAEERTQNAVKIAKFEGIIEGLDSALNILRKKPEKFVENCIFYDCYQGRNKCTHRETISNRCYGICVRYAEK